MFVSAPCVKKAFCRSAELAVPSKLVSDTSLSLESSRGARLRKEKKD